MKNYEKPNIRIVFFEYSDITTSGAGDGFSDSFSLVGKEKAKAGMNF